MKKALSFLFISLLVVLIILISAQYIFKKEVVPEKTLPQVIEQSTDPLMSDTLLYYLEKNQKEPIMVLSKYFDGNKTINPTGRSVTVYIEVIGSSFVSLKLENILTQLNYFVSEIPINNDNKPFIVPEGDWVLYMINHNSFSIEVKVKFYLPDW